MNSRAVSSATVVAGLLIGLTGCHALTQKPTEVVIRDPGAHFLSAPIPVEPEALQHLTYARLSEVAYWRTPEGQIADPQERAQASPTLPDSSPGQPVIVTASECPDPLVELAQSGWVYWKDFPNDGLNKKIQDSHLRVEVWSNAASNLVVVSFGGTSKSGKDWLSNLRWFLPAEDDEYTEIVKRVGPAFVTEYKERRNRKGWEFLQNARLYATGHSLGGGLAQQFAYALPPDPVVPRVTRVFAFDPSPVTGYYRVDKQTREQNRTSLYTDRIYQRGEILAVVRSLISVFYPPSASEPTIRGVRYALLNSWNPIARHSIGELTCKMTTAAEHSVESSEVSQNR